MSELRIIGIGSPIGDDQAGWLVVEALRRAPLAQRLPRHTRLIALDRPGAQLIAHLDGAHTLVVVDAICSGAPPGTIHRVDGAARIQADVLVSSHGLGLATALELARALGALPANVLIYGIEIDPATGAAAPGKAMIDVVDRLAAQIAGELAGPGGAPVPAPANAATPR